jgi:hypothetical protein
MLLYFRNALLMTLLSALFILPGHGLRADAIVKSNAMFSTTIVEIFIDEDIIVVDFEVGLNDLPAFANLLPDDLYERLDNEPIPLAKRMQRFLAEDFLLVPGNGEALKGEIIVMGPEDRVKRDAITGEPLPVDEDTAETVVRMRLAYELAGQPSELNIALGPAMQKAGIGFVVYHKTVAVNDFRYLTPIQTLMLDWEDPWYTSFTARGLRRSQFAPMSGFIYVEPYEVRKEIIVRPKDLQQWVDLGLEGRETIPVEIQAELKRKVGEFLRDKQPVVIDGQVVEPELARVNFLDRSLRTSMVIDPPRELPIDSAIMGVIFVYPVVEPLPQRVTMEWDMFNDKIPLVPASAVDQAGPLPTFLEPDFSTLEWQNFLKNPELPTLVAIISPPGIAARAAVYLRWVLGALTLWFFYRLLIVRRGGGFSAATAGLTLALAGATAGSWWLSQAAMISNEKAEVIVSGLLHNVYRAFDFRAEEQIYDVLDQSVTGDLLGEIYLETRRGLELANQGGARAKVKSVELVEILARAGENGGLIAETTWNVAGSVGHWGHIHERRNQYRATLNIEPVQNAWKLTDLKIQEEVRL